MRIPAAEAIPFLTRKAVENHWQNSGAQNDHQPKQVGEVVVELPGGVTGPPEKLFREDPARILAATSTAFRRYYRAIGVETTNINPVTQERTQLGNIRKELAELGKTRVDSKEYNAATERAADLATTASTVYLVSDRIPRSRRS